ncbi:apoptosis-inducing factor-like protein A-like [Senna tora]|uniref:Apoptosis-inducing factor-like protein A-like n=1 Tax=Senna tora TaxID=362788 RepID=A0A834TSP0_9FABA|nr:apoptosis-inducing factor-like protein A-like [Senna tora]
MMQPPLSLYAASSSPSMNRAIAIIGKEELSILPNNYEQEVVIVGGGVAGAFLAKILQDHAHITLIDPKEYFEIPWACLRAMVEPAVAERIVVNHRDYFKKGDLVTSSAVTITETEVFTEDGTQVPYDYLVIATGHTEPVPKTRDERINQFKEENEKIKSAKSILIVGGGPTGVELAGEIAVDFPEKKSKNVEVKLEQSVDLNSVSEGRKPLSSAWLRETLLKDDLDGDGRIKVDENLRVKGRNNIFAIGDITDFQKSSKECLHRVRLKWLQRI